MDNVPLLVEITEINEHHKQSSAASRIQVWWRNVLQRRKLERAALYNLFAQQRKRILERSASRKTNALAANRAFRSPRVATNIIKKMKNSEPVNRLLRDFY